MIFLSHYDKIQQMQEVLKKLAFIMRKMTEETERGDQGKNMPQRAWKVHIIDTTGENVEYADSK